MPDTSMSPETQIRVIKRALEILDAFTSKVQTGLASGEVKMTSQLQLQSRKNAQEESRLRRRLAEIEAGIAEPQGLEDESLSPDPVIEQLNKAILAGLPNFTAAETLASLPQSKNAILLTRMDDDSLELTAAIADGRDMDEFINELTSLMYEISLEIPSGPNKGNAIFMIGFNRIPDSLPERHRARTFHIYITQDA